MFTRSRACRPLRQKGKSRYRRDLVDHCTLRIWKAFRLRLASAGTHQKGVEIDARCSYCQIFPCWVLARRSFTQSLGRIWTDLLKGKAYWKVYFLQLYHMKNPLRSCAYPDFRVLPRHMPGHATMCRRTNDYLPSITAYKETTWSGISCWCSCQPASR